MALIHVPKPPKSAFNPERPISTLLRSQLQHFHVAHRDLPHRHQTDIYVNAIKTEGEAAAFIRQVTEGIHQAYAAAAVKRARPAAKRKRVPAAAGARSVRKGISAGKSKREGKPSRRRKR